MPEGHYTVRVYVATSSDPKEASYDTDNDFEITDSRTPNLRYMIPRTAQAEDLVAIAGTYRVHKVSEVRDFFTGEFFCDRFDFVYDLPLNNNNLSYPRCKLAQALTVGTHEPRFVTADGSSTLFNDKAYSYDL